MDADIVVVGAGIIGLSIARELKRAGFHSLVLEQSKAGREASWAGAGMLVPHGESFPDPEWSRRAHQALDMYPQFVKELAAESGVDIDFRVCGTIVEEGGERKEFPGEAQVNPRDVLAALLRGAEVQEQTQVDAIVPVSSGVRVAGIAARAAVVAAGAWSGLISGLPPSHPVRGHLIAYDMPPGSLSPILRRGHTYAVQRANGMTIVGSTEEQVGFNRELDRDALADLQQRGEAIWPELKSSKPVDAWSGFRPATPTGVPEVGRFGDSNIWLAYGHFRNGILLAPVTAQLIARDIISSLRKG